MVPIQCDVTTRLTGVDKTLSNQNRATVLTRQDTRPAPWRSPVAYYKTSLRSRAGS